MTDLLLHSMENDKFLKRAIFFSCSNFLFLILQNCSVGFKSGDIEYMTRSNFSLFPSFETLVSVCSQSLSCHYFGTSTDIHVRVGSTLPPNLQYYTVDCLWRHFRRTATATLITHTLAHPVPPDYYCNCVLTLVALESSCILFHVCRYFTIRFLNYPDNIFPCGVMMLAYR